MYKVTTHIKLHWKYSGSLNSTELRGNAFRNDTGPCSYAQLQAVKFKFPMAGIMFGIFQTAVWLVSERESHFTLPHRGIRNYIQHSLAYGKTTAV